MRMKIDPAPRVVVMAALDSAAQRRGFTPVVHAFGCAVGSNCVTATYQADPKTPELCPAFDLLDALDRVAHDRCWAPVSRDVDCMTATVTYTVDPKESAARVLVATLLGLSV